MKWQNAIVGAAIGFICGYATKCAVEKYASTSPDAILAKVKETVSREGKITGSWILMKPETYTKNGLHYEIFKGGLTQMAEDGQKHYEFIADATTGTVIDMVEQTI
ncbi:MAG: peptidase M4 [Bacillus sp. (in: firmicutes)]